MNKELISQLFVALSEYLTLPLLFIIRYKFYKNFLGFKKNITTYIFASFLSIIFNLVFTEINSGILVFIFEYIFIFLNLCYLCEGNFIMKLYAITVEYEVLFLVNLAYFPIDFWVIPIINNIEMSFTQHLIINFFNMTLSSILGYFILHIVYSKITNYLMATRTNLNLFQSVYLLLPCLSSLGLVIIFYLIQEIKINDKIYELPNLLPKIYYIILPFICFLFLVSIPIMAYTFKKVLDSEEDTQKRLIIEQQFMSYCNHIKNIDTIYLGLRKVRHDINNHISCLKVLSEDNNIVEIKNYLHNLTDAVSKLDFKIKTGNPISDAIINEKHNISCSEGIEFFCNFIVPQNILLDPIDLCIILGNSLDNSIEACKKINVPNIPKNISIISYVKGLYLIIEISNTFSEKPKFLKNKIISNKINKVNHGLGLENINDIVKKYNGTMDILLKKNCFTLSMMLKIK